ncbi:MAG: acyltransferase [Deltaproteobacteria bacterium]|nr:acyltransferase [Deltaproteobacteria bacterium]
MSDHSQVVARVMFDWESLGPDEVKRLSQPLPRKLLRWLGTHHPDNRTRKLFFRLTGVHIGKGTNITPGLVINDGYSGLCSIGDRVSIATNVTLVADSNPNNSILAEHPYVKQHLIKTAPVIIEDDAWLGTNAIVLPGVRIGRGSIVGAGAVVVNDVPPHTIVAGVPARVVRSLGDDSAAIESDTQ